MTTLKPEIFLLTSDPIDQSGGQERYFGQLIAGFEQRGYSVRVFHKDNTWPTWWRKPTPSNRLGWIVSGTLQSLFIGRAARAQLHPGVAFVLSSATVGWYPQPKTVKQVHIYHGTYATMAKAIAKELTLPGRTFMKLWSCHVLERFGGYGKLVLCNSEQTTREVAQLFGQTGQTIWCPLDLNYFTPHDSAACRRELGLREDVPVGLFVGYCHSLKGWDTVRAMLNRFSELQWLVVVRGSLPDELAGMPNVHAIPNAGYAQLPTIYAAADFSLCPSRYEAFGYVLAEAIACGTPVIATPGGASSVLYDAPPLSSLLIQSADDYDGFERAIRRVIESPDVFRQAVLNHARPKLAELVDNGPWWRRFLKAIGLEDKVSAEG